MARRSRRSSRRRRPGGAGATTAADRYAVRRDRGSRSSDVRSEPRTRQPPRQYRPRLRPDERKPKPHYIAAMPTPMIDELEGKTAVVTGAASGIGFELTKRLLREGAR